MIISGGYEFTHPQSMGQNPSRTALLAKAYAHLPYDLFLLATADYEDLIHNNLNPEPVWHGPIIQPRVIIEESDQGSMAFVLFPDAQKNKSEHLIPEVGDLVRKLRHSKKYNLIIGLSTWGSTKEEEFITSQPNTVDILLGSGDGPGYTGLYLEENKVLWVRAFARGKAVNLIRIPTLPDPQNKTIWQPQETIITEVITLDHRHGLDEELNLILSP